MLPTSVFYEMWYPLTLTKLIKYKNERICYYYVFCFQQAIADKYKVAANQIRAYIHYHPTYYHLHVHFTLVGYQAPGSMIGQSHLLEDVIENIKRVDPNYYANRTLIYQIREDSPIIPLVLT